MLNAEHRRPSGARSPAQSIAEPPDAKLIGDETQPESEPAEPASAKHHAPKRRVCGTARLQNAAPLGAKHFDEIVDQCHE